MSAFVIDTATMNRVVDTLTARGDYGAILGEFAGIRTTDRDARTRIGRLLFTLNVEAVTQRYVDGREDDMDLPGPTDCRSFPESYSYVVRHRPFVERQTRLVAGYKALRCLLYQCSEGDVPKTPLFKELQAAAAEVAHEIVSSLPQYEEAAWG